VVFTPTFTLIPSPSVPMVSVTTGTNCRTGPGREYDIVGGAPVGVKFVVIGRNTSTDYWIIRLQDGRECWLWGRHAVVEGNVSTLPEYAIPALPVGSVAGIITDYTGAGIPNATVTALLSQKTASTGSNGRFSIDNLRTGQEFLDVRASGVSTRKHLRTTPAVIESIYHSEEIS
jgi:hypothetical protein